MFHHHKVSVLRFNSFGEKDLERDKHQRSSLLPRSLLQVVQTLPPGFCRLQSFQQADVTFSLQKKQPQRPTSTFSETALMLTLLFFLLCPSGLTVSLLVEFLFVCFVDGGRSGSFERGVDAFSLSVVVLNFSSSNRGSDMID